MTVVNCAITDNSAVANSGIENTGTITVTNCTIAGNTATETGAGFSNFGTATILDSTITDNKVTQSNPNYVGGGIWAYRGELTIGNTIVAGNSAAIGPDVDGAVVSQGNNLIGQTNGSTGWITSDLTGTTASPLNPLLGPLANNGGPTETMALLPGSPAIAAGNVALIPAGITTDQRGPGYARVVNGNVDIGAV